MWMASPSISAASRAATASASTSISNSSRAWPWRTTPAIVAHHRSLNPRWVGSRSGCRRAETHRTTPHPPSPRPGARGEPAEPLDASLEPIELGPHGGVERGIDVRDRRPEQIVLGPEVVDDAGRTRARALGHIRHAYAPQTALAQQFDRGGEDLRLAHLGQRAARGHVLDPGRAVVFVSHR